MIDKLSAKIAFFKILHGYEKLLFLIKNEKRWKCFKK